MRTLTPALLKAQKGDSRTPYIRVEACNKMDGLVNLKWNKLYSGTEPHYCQALTLPGDGSLIRLRVTPLSDARKLYRQRVTNPGPESDFSQWIYLNQYNIAATTAGSLGAEVSLFWVKTNGEIARQRSADSGGSWQSIDYPGYAPTGNVSGMTAAYKPNGDLALFFTDSSTLYVIKRTAGVWQARTAWNKSTGNLSGAAAVYDGDWKLLVSGKETDGTYKIWSLVYGDGNEVPAGTWSPLHTIASAPADSLYEYGEIFLDKPDTFRATFVERYTGNQAYNRPYFSYTLPETPFGENRWREPLPFDTESPDGISIGHSAEWVWLATSNGVWRASLSDQSIDLSRDIINLKEELTENSGEIIIELRNEKGQYNNLTGGLETLPYTGCQINFSSGLLTPEGNQVSPGQSFTLRSFEMVYPAKDVKSAKQTSVLLYASDGWSALENWKARYLFRWNKDSDETCVKEMLAALLARAGIKLEIISQSELINNFFPDFTINPGENGKEAIAKLLSFVPDLIFIEGQKAYLLNPLPQDEAVYSYGSGHPIFESKFRRAMPRFNRVQTEGFDTLSGTSIVTESFWWPSISSTGDIPIRIEDRNLESAALTSERGEIILKKELRKTDRFFMRAGVNCGQQIYDVVEITDPAAGLFSVKKRILGVSLLYNPDKATYEQKMVMGDL